MERKNGYGKIRQPDSTFPRFRRSSSWFRLYSKLVSSDKAASNPPSERIATTTSAGGVTTVNTTTLLAQPSVKQAIEILSAKAAEADTPNKK